MSKGYPWTSVVSRVVKGSIAMDWVSTSTLYSFDLAKFTLKKLILSHQLEGINDTYPWILFCIFCCLILFCIDVKI